MWVHLMKMEIWVENKISRDVKDANISILASRGFSFAIFAKSHVDRVSTADYQA